MSREEGVQHVLEKQYEFPYEYLTEFLEYHQMTEDELHKCEDQYRNLDIWHKKNGKWRLKVEVS